MGNYCQLAYKKHIKAITIINKRPKINHHNVNRSSEMYSPIRQNTKKQQCTSAFNKNILLCAQEYRQTTKEEGSKEEDRQERADVKKR